MSYFDDFSFASGKYFIDSKGIVTFSEDASQELKSKFWNVWIKIRPVIIEREKNGHYSSMYPMLPIEDEDPNKNQYKDLLNIWEE